MNVSLKNNDAVSGILKIEIEKNDYAENLEKNLHKLRQKVNMQGFRKGMVPLGMVKKLYGKQALAEEVNNIISEKVYGYIKENNIEILGQPVPNKSEQKPINFDTDENFEFCFDLAIAPKIDLKLTKKDKLTYYQIKVDDELIEKQTNNYLKNFGTYENADTVEEEDLVKGIVAELDENGGPKAGGILIEEGVLMPKYMKGKTEQKKFIGKKVGAKLTFNPYKAYKGAEAELASFLKISKDKVKDMKSDFTFEIKEITRHKDAEMNQDLFDKVFGKDIVKDETAFRGRVQESLAEQFKPQSDYKFINDTRSFFVKKVGDMKFADDILKRWLLMNNEKATEEDVNKDYPNVVEDLKYHLTREKLVKDNDVKVEEPDIKEMAKRVAKAQFAQYGIISVPDDVIENYAKEMMAKKETVNNLVDRVIDEKILALLKDKITVDTKEVSAEEFGKILDKEREQNTTDKKEIEKGE